MVVYDEALVLGGLAPNLTKDTQVVEDFIDYPQNSFTDMLHSAEPVGFYLVEVRMK